MSEAILKMIAENPEMISGFVNECKPLIYAVGRELLAVYRDFRTNQELAEIAAIHNKTYYDACIAQGFTEDQAMSLLLTNIRREATAVDGITKIASQPTVKLSNK